MGFAQTRDPEALRNVLRQMLEPSEVTVGSFMSAVQAGRAAIAKAQGQTTDASAVAQGGSAA